MKKKITSGPGSAAICTVFNFTQKALLAKNESEMNGHDKYHVCKRD